MCLKQTHFHGQGAWHPGPSRAEGSGSGALGPSHARLLLEGAVTHPQARILMLRCRCRAPHLGVTNPFTWPDLRTVIPLGQQPLSQPP